MFVCVADATEEQIKHRFKKLALRWHPDKNLYNQKEAHEASNPPPLPSLPPFLPLPYNCRLDVVCTLVSFLQKFQSISAAYSRLAASEGEEAIEDISPVSFE